MNNRELAFCHYYAKTGKAIESAEAAGFKSARSGAHAILKRPHVQEQINWLKDRVRELMVLDVAVVVNELGAIALTRTDEYLDQDEDGHWFGKAPEQLTEQQRAAVKEIKVRDIWEGEGAERHLVRQEFKYVMHDKLSALYKLGDHLGLGSGAPTDRRNPFERMDQAALDRLGDAFRHAMESHAIEGEVDA